MAHCGFPDKLLEILNDRTILKCGVAISGDIHKLHRDFSQVARWPVHTKRLLVPICNAYTCTSRACTTCVHALNDALEHRHTPLRAVHGRVLSRELSSPLFIWRFSLIRPIRPGTSARRCRSGQAISRRGRRADPCRPDRQHARGEGFWDNISGKSRCNVGENVEARGDSLLCQHKLRFDFGVSMHAVRVYTCVCVWLLTLCGSHVHVPGPTCQTAENPLRKLGGTSAE